MSENIVSRYSCFCRFTGSKRESSIGAQRFPVGVFSLGV